MGDSESGLKRSAGTAGLDTNQSTGDKALCVSRYILALS